MQALSITVLVRGYTPAPVHELSLPGIADTSTRLFFVCSARWHHVTGRSARRDSKSLTYSDIHANGMCMPCQFSKGCAQK